MERSDLTRKIIERPYLTAGIITLVIFLFWEFSDLIIFGEIVPKCNDEITRNLEILRGFIFSLTIALIVVMYSKFLAHRELICESEMLTLLDHMTDGLVEFNSHGKILLVNKKMISLMEVKNEEELKNKSITDFFSSESKKIMENFNPKKTKALQGEELVLKSKTGILIPVLVSTSRIGDQNRYLRRYHRFLMIFTDVSQLRGAQEQIKRLMHAEKVSALGSLIAGIGHEINNPLSFLISDADRIEEYVQNLARLIEKYELLEETVRKNTISDPEIDKILQDLLKDRKEFNIQEMFEDLPEIIISSKDGLNRIAKVVKDIRIFSQMGKHTEKVPEQLNKIVLLSLALVRKQIADRIVLVENLSDDLPDINLNPGRVAQVVMNLILNSIQAIRSTGTIYVRTFLDKPNEMVTLEIEDTGVGIPKENFSKLFDPYFTTKFEGTGLGLAIARNIIADHDGEISVKSEVNKGTLFTIKIPLIKENGLEKP